MPKLGMMVDGGGGSKGGRRPETLSFFGDMWEYTTTYLDY